jgi:hypothetical protein
MQVGRSLQFLPAILFCRAPCSRRKQSNTSGCPPLWTNHRLQGKNAGSAGAEGLPGALAAQQGLRYAALMFARKAVHICKQCLSLDKASFRFLEAGAALSSAFPCGHSATIQLPGSQIDSAVWPSWPSIGVHYWFGLTWGVSAARQPTSLAQRGTDCWARASRASWTFHNSAGNVGSRFWGDRPWDR